jgi:2-dehydro-3-deoxygluconokinase
MRILAIGECMAELAPLGASGAFKLGFAGDTFNTAWYIAQLSPGADVAYFTVVGDDALSNEMREFMTASGIDTSPIREIAGGTVGLYMIHLADSERSFSYWRNSSAARQLATNTADLDSAISGADLIYYSGITLGILDAPSRQNLLAALQKGRAAGKTIAFDTNIRPKAIQSDPLLPIRGYRLRL